MAGLTADIKAVLQGALHVWRGEGIVTAAPGGCAIRAGGRVVTLARMREDGEAPYWEVGVDGGPPPQPCAGIHGMLRAVRDLLDPSGAAQRLVVGRVS